MEQIADRIVDNLPADIISRFGAEFVAKTVFNTINKNKGTNDINSLTSQVLATLKNRIAEAKELYKEKKESGDLHFSDPVMKQFMDQARAKYPWLGSDESILFKLLQRSMTHSVEADVEHDERLEKLTQRVRNLEKTIQNDKTNSN
jgi:chorismate mutase